MGFTQFTVFRTIIYAFRHVEIRLTKEKQTRNKNENNTIKNTKHKLTMLAERILFYTDDQKQVHLFSL